MASDKRIIVKVSIDAADLDELLRVYKEGKFNEIGSDSIEIDGVPLPSPDEMTQKWVERSGLLSKNKSPSPRK